MYFRNTEIAKLTVFTPNVSYKFSMVVMCYWTGREAKSAVCNCEKKLPFSSNIHPLGFGNFVRFKLAVLIVISCVDQQQPAHNFHVDEI